MPERTPEGKVILFRISTGDAFERWPVDARDMLATGDYTTDPPKTATADAVPVDTAASPVLPVSPTLSPELEAIVGPTKVSATPASPAAPVVLPKGRKAKG
jgi:hypothetical protein